MIDRQNRKKKGDMDMTMGIGGIQPDMAYKNKTVEEKRAKQTESEETKGTSFSGPG